MIGGDINVLTRTLHCGMKGVRILKQIRFGRRSSRRRSYTARFPILSEFGDYVAAHPVKYILSVVTGTLLVFAAPLLAYALMVI